MGISDQIDGAALAAVPAIRTAARDELLATEAEGSRAAVTGGNVDLYFVDEHLLGDGMHADEAAARPVIFELHASGDFGEERIVLAEADVQPGSEPATALADENRAAGDDVAVVPLDAEPLRIAVASVTRTSLALF
jgi:hypothetical protein